MPFDGTAQACSVVEGLQKLIAFFGTRSNWYRNRERHCETRGAHSYADGRMCLSGALASLRAEGVPDDVRRYVLYAIGSRTGWCGSIERFNQTTTHRGLMAVLREAHKIALIAAGVAPPPNRNCMWKIQVRPTPADAPVEVLLLDDLIWIYQNGRHPLSEAIYFCRTARGVRGDKTAKYLRRAFRHVPWTFGSVRSFDNLASPELLMGVLKYARELALQDFEKRARARDPLRIAA
jgi:hypothetical protein